MKKLFLLLPLLVGLLTGCIMPKPIEFGQDRVHRLPTAKPRETEVQRQTAQRAAVKAQETLQAAIDSDANNAVVAPATETAVLTESVSRSVGPPLSPAPDTITSKELAKQLDTAVAKLNSRLEDFRKDNDENAGKKIEGTGVFQMGYITYLVFMFFALVAAVIGFKVLKTFAHVAGVANPGVAVGVRAVEMGGAAASRALGQLIKGGENFKDKLAKELPELDASLKAKVEELFRTAHQTAQDEDVQYAVKALTRK